MRTGSQDPPLSDAASGAALSGETPSRRRRFDFGLGTVAVVAALLVAAGAAWTIAARSGSSVVATPGNGPRLVNSGDLALIGILSGHPVFWAGPRPGQRVQFSSSGDGNINLRYLGPEHAAGSGSLLNVATYPFAGAYRATRRLAMDPDLRTIRVAGAIGFVDPDRPYRVVLAWPTHPDLQVAVYDPVKYRALKVVRTGAIVPVP